MNGRSSGIHTYPARRLAALLVLLPVLWAASLVTAEAQQPGEDSTWVDDLVLDPDDFDFAEDLVGHHSRGWFPSAFTFSSLMAMTDLLYADLFDRGSELRSASFVETPFAFTWRDPYASGERDILEPNSDDETDDRPYGRYDEYSLGYLIGLPMPAILRLKASFHMQNGLLYSLDTTRSYLGFDGRKRFLKEVGVVYLEEYLIGGTAGVQIPIYGVFFDSDLSTISSYYYLHASFGGTFAFLSRGTQYVQIANAKDELRYRNGSDTATLIRNTRFEDLKRFRTHYELGLGWNFAAEFVTFAFESFITIPITPVLRDAEWRQFTAGFRLGIGYQWL